MSLAKQKRLRWTPWRTPARVITTARRDIILILNTWPTADDILGAYRNTAVLA